MPRKKRSDHELFKSDVLNEMSGATLLSGNYFNAAEGLRQIAWKDNNSDIFVHSLFTIPAIIMYVTALEVFINEHSKKELRDMTLNKEKIGQFVVRNRVDVTLKKCVWYQDVLALVNLRNELVHYAPIMRKLTTAPSDVAHAMKRSKITLFRQSGYITNLSNPEFADWACSCIRRFGEEVSRNWYPGNNSLMLHAEYFAILEANSVSNT
jgi:hypothetical protein